MQAVTAPVGSLSAPTLPRSLGTLTIATWSPRANGTDTYGGFDTTVVPALTKTVLRTGLPNVMEAVRLLSEDQRRHPSADLGYVALVRHGATLDAVQLRNEPGIGWIRNFQPAPGIEVDAIWHMSGYPTESWPRLAASAR